MSEKTFVSLEKVCVFKNGFAFKSSKFRTEGTPILRIGNIKDDKIEPAGTPFASPDDYTEDLSKYTVTPTDIVIAMSGATTGKVAKNTTEITFYQNQRVGKFIPSPNLNKDYLFNFLKTKVQEALKISIGSAQPNLSTKQINDFQIPLPPLPEQKRIVEKLDACQGHIDRSKSALDTIPQLLEDYRASLLAKAFNGELTADWRAEQLAQGIQHEWKVEPLINIISEGPRNGYSPKCSANTTGSVILKLSATTKGKLILTEKTTKRSIDIVDENSHAWLEDGDILVQRANSLELLGTTVIYIGPSQRYVYPDLMMRLRTSNPFTRKYITYFLNSYEARSYFRDNATGTAGNMPKINGKTLKATMIPLPSLAEQKEIVNQLETAFKRIDDIKLLHSKLSIQHSELTQSLLAKAFRGELIK